MYNKLSNIQLKTLYTPETSYLSLSYYGQYLVFKLVPWIGKDNGRDQYSKEKFISTTLSPDGAKCFYEVVTSILKGAEPEKPLPMVLQCKRETILTLDYKPDENNQMTASLVANKNNETISFKFKTQQIPKWVDGQMVTQVIQVDLQEFAMILYGYIHSSGDAEYLLNKAIG